ncbi:hypothetical protein DFJ73DRAFT_811338, partial [Zopfochytrium polystomum]
MCLLPIPGPLLSLPIASCFAVPASFFSFFFPPSLVVAFLASVPTPPFLQCFLFCVFIPPSLF